MPDLSNLLNWNRYSEFGFDFGGPILHDKLFYFVNYEGYRRTTSNVQNATTPTALSKKAMPTITVDTTADRTRTEPDNRKNPVRCNLNMLDVYGQSITETPNGLDRVPIEGNVDLLS